MTCRPLSRLLKVDSQIFVAVPSVLFIFSVFFWPHFGQIFTTFHNFSGAGLDNEARLPIV